MLALLMLVTAVLCGGIPELNPIAGGAKACLNRCCHQDDDVAAVT